MKQLSLLLFLLTACSFETGKTDDLAIVKELPAPKQKQRIAFLQKKLAMAEKEKEKADGEVVRLRKEIHYTQLALIRKQIDDYELQMPQTFFIPKERGPLFLKEREDLHTLIQSESSSEAQALLDRILRLITELSDDSKG